MAYILKNQSKAIKLESKSYGLSLPVFSEFKTTFNKIKQAEYNLYNLLRTRRGERVMLPNFGCNLESLLFEPNSDFLESNIRDDITKSVSYWLPYINITNISIDASDNLIDQNKIEVSISYTISDLEDINTITFNINPAFNNNEI